MTSTDDLCVMLVSPDPHVRDEVGYETLAARIHSGGLDGQLTPLGDRLGGNFAHPEIQARTFTPLILASVVIRDNAVAELDAETVRRWRDAFTTWWLSETDLRGYDDELGWLHAIAHGADLLRALGNSRHLDAAALVALLDLARARLLTPTDYLFAHGEDDRIAVAVALLLSREELDVEAATGWLEPIGAQFEAGEPGPVPAWAANTVRTLNSLYVVVDRGVSVVGPTGERLPPRDAPHRTEIRDALATTLRHQSPYLA